MLKGPKNPFLLELHAFVFLHQLSEKYKKTLTLLTVPDDEWVKIREKGFDYVWLMGVWQRSPGARKMALHDEGLKRVYDRIRPEWKPADIAGSAYAVYDYSLDPGLGEKKDLRELKTKLHRYGLKLILDFVPNHLAFDHPWTLSHPEYFVRTADDKIVHEHPDWFFQTEKGAWLAHGRDPYYAPWRDSVQINYFSPDLRREFLKILNMLAECSDGIRCDMAMLGLTEIFRDVWKIVPQIHEGESREFWAEIIPSVKKKAPDFLFIAEVYWDKEWALQQLGFDYTYDKRFYDRLYEGKAEDLRGHLKAEINFQHKLLRFIENHDEPRSIGHFGREKIKAAACAALTVPGMKMIYGGQMMGFKHHVPVQFKRGAVEKADAGITFFYAQLMECLASPVFREGEWGLLEAAPVHAEDFTWNQILAWFWRFGNKIRIIVINYSDRTARAHIKLPPALLPSDFTVEDVFSETLYEGKDALLPIELPAWKVLLCRSRNKI